MAGRAQDPGKRGGGRLGLACAVAVLAAVAAGPAAAAPPAEQGKALFATTCAGCHTVGGGKKVGPDLEGVVARLGADRVRAFILAPARERPGTAMPDLGLTTSQADALVAFLAASAPPAPAPAPAPAPVPAQGDADRGKNLFTGADRLDRGGPPCLSCHSIAGIGALGGGALGPDLTKASTKYGGLQALRGLLASLPFPTMAPIYRDRPLAAGEQADLAAFLERASRSERPGSAVWALFLLGLGGVVLFLLLVALAWPRRALSVRRRLLGTSSTAAKG